MVVLYSKLSVNFLRADGFEPKKTESQHIFVWCTKIKPTGWELAIGKDLWEPWDGAVFLKQLLSKTHKSMQTKGWLRWEGHSAEMFHGIAFSVVRNQWSSHGENNPFLGKPMKGVMVDLGTVSQCNCNFVTQQKMPTKDIFGQSPWYNADGVYKTKRWRQLPRVCWDYPPRHGPSRFPGFMGTVNRGVWLKVSLKIILIWGAQLLETTLFKSKGSPETPTVEQVRRTYPVWQSPWLPLIFNGCGYPGIQGYYPRLGSTSTEWTDWQPWPPIASEGRTHTVRSIKGYRTYSSRWQFILHPASGSQSIRDWDDWNTIAKCTVCQLSE